MSVLLLSVVCLKCAEVEAQFDSAKSSFFFPPLNKFLIYLKKGHLRGRANKRTAEKKPQKSCRKYPRHLSASSPHIVNVEPDGPWFVPSPHQSSFERFILQRVVWSRTLCYKSTQRFIYNFHQKQESPDSTALQHTSPPPLPVVTPGVMSAICITRFPRSRIKHRRTLSGWPCTNCSRGAFTDYS